MLSRRFLRIKALKSMYSHFTINDESLIETRNKMIFSVNKTYDLYYLLLNLVVEVADYADEVANINRAKHLANEADKNPNMKFINNSFINMIRNDENIKRYIDKNDISWGDNKELFKKIYQSLLGREYYSRYMSSTQHSFEEDKEVVLKFYKKELENNDLLFSIVEEMSLYWVDEVEFIASKVLSTYVKWSEDSQTLYPLYIDSDDEQFVKDLLIHSISNYDKAFDCIKQYSKNWDSERVTLMDKLIITLAYTEFVDFPTVPINVSLDEYIEISKYYSTPNSNIYVNGILDKVLTNLRREDKIIKTGRGLQ